MWPTGNSVSSFLQLQRPDLLHVAHSFCERKITDVVAFAEAIISFFPPPLSGALRRLLAFLYFQGSNTIFSPSHSAVG